MQLLTLVRSQKLWHMGEKADAHGVRFESRFLPKNICTLSSQRRIGPKALEIKVSHC